MVEDKQLSGIRLEDVLKKRELDQALNAKEFAVVAGISYTASRRWMSLPGFPVFEGVIFWNDFVQWRRSQNGLKHDKPSLVKEKTAISASLPAKAQKILLEA